MIIDEKKILRYMDLGFYTIFAPIILMLIPTNRLVENDTYFFLVLIIYMVVIHTINRRHNIVVYLLNGRYWSAFGIVATTVAIAYFTGMLNIQDLRDPNTSPPVKAIHEMRLRSVWLLFFIDLCFNVMLGLVIELYRQRIERAEIESQKSRAEIALYKSQINPHFMFNTLNTLYGLFVTKSPQTGEVFIKFTDMIKYMYSNSERDTIPLAEEVRYLREYIDLHTLRLGTQTEVLFHCAVDDDSLQIPPMLLITFVENAFKYGVSSAQQSVINIELTLSNGRLNFSTLNTIFTRNTSGSGIGIENCRKRLDLLYGSRYTLETLSEGELFTTKLKIDL